MFAIFNLTRRIEISGQKCISKSIRGESPPACLPTPHPPPTKLGPSPYPVLAYTYPTQPIPFG